MADTLVWAKRLAPGLFVVHNSVREFVRRSEKR